MAKNGKPENLLDHSPTRRHFMQLAGAAGLGLAGAGWLANTNTALAQSITDTDILNFALNLEYLEAEFYTVATTGKTLSEIGIPTNGSGNAGPTTGGSRVNLHIAVGGDRTKTIAEQIAYDEQRHVLYIRNALSSLGVQPVAKPAINLNALGFGFGNLKQFLALARAFEDVGVTAYGGAAPLIQNTAVLGAAARILAAEAEHSSNIRLQVALNGVATTQLDGVDILPPPSGSQFFSLDLQNAQTAIRTPGQVLFIVYGFQANVMSGGFFPNGVNGAIHESSNPA
jgi:hypothetical protein